jgi:hypothetical protein
MHSEITNTLTALENCICLLFPTPENFFIQDGNEIEIKSKNSEEKPSPTDTREIEDQNENEEQGLDQKDRLSELSESDRKVEKKKDAIKNDCDVPSTSRSKDDDIEEDNSEFGSEISDSEEDIDFREYGILNSKYHIEVNVNTGICQ